MNQNSGLLLNVRAIATLSMERCVEVVVTVVNIWTLKSFQVGLVIMLAVEHYKKNGTVVEKSASQWQINTTLIYQANSKMKMLFS